MKMLLVSGGCLTEDFLKEYIENNEINYIISVDSGANALYKAKVSPDVLLGDFDSIDQEVLDYFVNQGIEIMKFPPEKDVTDTELAIEYAIEHGAQEFIIVGASGTRMDHTLANIQLLVKYCNLVDCSIIDAHNFIKVYKGENNIMITQKGYRYISLVPVSEVVVGVTTYGLKYPLNRATLRLGDSLGVSNEILEESGSISMVQGIMAVIQSRD